MMERFYPESRFGGFTSIDGTVAFYARAQSLIDGTVAFYARAQSLIDGDSVVIDFGCGRGAYQNDSVAFRRNLRIFRGSARQVIGLDASPAGADNPYVDEFHLLNGPTWPISDHFADLIICDNVLEHLEDPDGFFREAWRVLRPGGYLAIRTPNRWNYIAVLSRLVPNRDHARLLAKAKPGLKEQDVFPTYYRCNTIPALRGALQRSKFTGVVFGYEAEPSYLAFSPVTYTLGMLHQKLAPSFLKAAIFVFARKM